MPLPSTSLMLISGGRLDVPGDKLGRISRLEVLRAVLLDSRSHPSLAGKDGKSGLPTGGRHGHLLLHVEHCAGAGVGQELLGIACWDLPEINVCRNCSLRSRLGLQI